MYGRLIVEAIYVLKQLMKKYRERKKGLYMTFIDFKKLMMDIKNKIYLY